MSRLYPQAYLTRTFYAPCMLMWPTVIYACGAEIEIPRGVTSGTGTPDECETFGFTWDAQ